MHQSAAALGAGTYGDVRKACDTLQTHPRPSPPTDYQCSDLPLGPHAPYQRVAVKTMKVAPYNDDEELDGEIAKIQHEVEMHATLSTHEHPHPNMSAAPFEALRRTVLMMPIAARPCFSIMNGRLGMIAATRSLLWSCLVQTARWKS